jgi:hypothetical protein
MAKQKELTTLSTENKVSTEFEQDDDFMALLPRAESSDFDIPRLTLIQPTSKIEGAPGDIIDSATGEKVAGLGQKLVFACVYFLKDFSVSELDSKKFRRNEPKTPDNAHLSTFDNRISTDPDGVAVERKERLNIFVVQESTLDEDLPRVYRMILKPSSFKEAKKLLSEWDIQIRSRMNPIQFLWSVTPRQVTNEKGKYAVYEFQKEIKTEMVNGVTLKKQRRVSVEALDKLKFWAKTLSQNEAKVLKAVATEDDEPKVVEQDAIPF